MIWLETEAGVCGGGIDGGDLYPAVICFLNDDIAGQRQADFVLQQQGLKSQCRVAGAEDEVGAELDADLGLQRPADVYLAGDAKSFVDLRRHHLDDGVIERRVERLRKIVAHGGADQLGLGGRFSAPSRRKGSCPP